MKKHANTICACALLLAGLVLLQAHALPFWQALSGPVLGVVWSLTLEGAALWLLFQRGVGARILGLLAALAILSAPLWQVGQPVIARLQGAHAQIAQMNAYQHALSQAQHDKKRYQALAVQRIGWHGQITAAEAREASARAALATLRAKGTPSVWGEAAPLLPLLFSLVFFQAINLLAVHTLRQACYQANLATKPHVAATKPLPQNATAPQPLPQNATVPHVAATKPMPQPLPQNATVPHVAATKPMPQPLPQNATVPHVAATKPMPQPLPQNATASKHKGLRAGAPATKQPPMPQPLPQNATAPQPLPQNNRPCHSLCHKTPQRHSPCHKTTAHATALATKRHSATAFATKRHSATGDPRFVMRSVVHWLRNLAQVQGTWEAVAIKLGIERAEISRYVNEAEGRRSKRGASADTRKKLEALYTHSTHKSLQARQQSVH